MIKPSNLVDIWNIWWKYFPFSYLNISSELKVIPKLIICISCSFKVIRLWSQITGFHLFVLSVNLIVQRISFFVRFTILYVVYREAVF